MIGDAHCAPVIDPREFGIGAAANDRHHAVAVREALNRSPTSTTVPAISSPITSLSPKFETGPSRDVLVFLDRLDVAEGAQTDVVEKLPCAGVVGVQHPLGAPEIERRSVPPLQRHPHERGQVEKDGRNLERAHQSIRATSAGAVAVMSRPS
ncbi:hypothetical protein J2W51_003358 [Tardiphaga robiniae]|nr:hypothetical protein [Tardiphaga robiniae]